MSVELNANQPCDSSTIISDEDKHKPVYWMEMAASFHNNGRYDLAEAQLREGLIHCPGDEKILTFLYVVLCYQKNYQNALDVIASILDMKSAKFFSHNSIVLFAYQKIGDFFEPEQISEENFWGYLVKGNAWKSKGNNAEFVSCYGKALDCDPSNVFVRSVYGTNLVGLGKFEEADQVLMRLPSDWSGPESVLRIDPTNAEWLILPVGQPNFEKSLSRFDEIVVLIGCDFEYFSKYGPGQIANLVNVGGAKAIHYHVIGEEHEVKKIFNSMLINAGDVKIGLTIQSDETDATDWQRRTFYACVRFLILPTLLEKYGCPILVLDADTIITKPLHEVVYGNGDIYITKSNNPTPWEIYQASPILVRPSLSSWRFCAVVASYIKFFLSLSRAIWFLDQIALFFAMTHKDLFSHGIVIEHWGGSIGLRDVDSDMDLSCLAKKGINFVNCQASFRENTEIDDMYLRLTADEITE